MAEKRELKKYLIDNISLKELLMNSDFKKSVQDVADSALQYWGFKIIPIDFIWDKNGEIAYITDKRCVINLNSMLEVNADYNQRKRNTIGKLAHEVFGHGLFTDFGVRNSLIDKLSSGEFVLEKYFKMADNYSADIISEIRDCYNSNYDNFISVFFDIENIIEDPTVEYFCIQKYKGFQPYLKDLIRLLVSTFDYSTTNPLNALLIQARNAANSNLESRFSFLNKTQAIFDNIPNMKEYEDRLVASCFAFICMWNEYLKEKMQAKDELSGMLNEYQNSEGKTSDNNDRSLDGQDNASSNREGCDDRDVSDNVSSTSQNPSSSTTSDNKNKSDTADDSTQEENNSSNSSEEIDEFVHSDDETGVTDNADMDFSDLLDKIVNETISEFVDRVFANKKNIPSIENDYEKNIVIQDVWNNECHKNYPFQIHKGKIGTTDEYNRLCTDKVKNIAHNLAMQISRKIKVRQKTHVLYEQDEGSMLDINAYSNKSDRIFMNINQPVKKQLMAVTVLMDQSGSMTGDRNFATTIAAIVLERFCRELSIPINIIGHNDASGVNLYNYIEHSEVNNKNRGKKLTRIGTGGCNRDGFAIRYALTKLIKRQEPVKILFIISDGLPNSIAYGTEQAIKDIADIKRICKKKNVTLIALAIGDDIKKLKNIYGDALIDARNLNEFPKLLTNMLLKELKKILF